MCLHSRKCVETVGPLEDPMFHLVAFYAFGATVGKTPVPTERRAPSRANPAGRARAKSDLGLGLLAIGFHVSSVFHVIRGFQYSSPRPGPIRPRIRANPKWRPMGAPQVIARIWGQGWKLQ